MSMGFKHFFDISLGGRETPLRDRDIPLTWSALLTAQKAIGWQGIGRPGVNHRANAGPPVGEVILPNL